MSGSPHFNKKNLEHVEMVTSGAAPIGAKDLDKLLPKLSPKAKILQGELFNFKDINFYYQKIR